jgi:hypothetical protein
MNMQAETMRTMPTALLLSGLMAVPTLANTSSQAACHRAPINSGQRLPYFSTTYSP